MANKEVKPLKYNKTDRYVSIIKTNVYIIGNVCIKCRNRKYRQCNIPS
jgi:hypothetical protein